MGFEFVTESDPAAFDKAMEEKFKAINGYNGTIQSIEFSTAAAPIENERGQKDYVVQYSAIITWSR